LSTKYSYWVFRNVISEEERKKIKRLARKSGYAKATTRDQNLRVSEEHDRKERDTDTAFSNNKYLYDLLCPFVHSANESAGWKYDVDWFESVQIARYKKNQHYAWHNDGNNDHFASYDEDGNYKGKVRKLSLVSCISNGFDGGELEFSIQDGTEDKNSILTPELKVGDVVVFPSFVQHRSTPITKGTKYSVAMWCLGPPFK